MLVTPDKLMLVTPDKLMLVTPDKLMVVTPDKLMLVTPDKLMLVTPDKLMLVTSDKLMLVTPDKLMPVTPDMSDASIALCRVWGRECDDGSFEGPAHVGSPYTSWRNMFLTRPQPRYNGCYIAKTSYFRCHMFCNVFATFYVLEPYQSHLHSWIG